MTGNEIDGYCYKNKIYYFTGNFVDKDGEGVKGKDISLRKTSIGAQQNMIRSERIIPQRQRKRARQNQKVSLYQ